ncbi:hypothetical protein CYMTET_38298 [Cymbomonas tetramitiformis]|uniref:Uncharacterized protein n=1 Tax=Cymbomonas tetramitiformis TaxID=36881 RepID=A0AAE0CEI9_9CHLO|nr:hypothetical protein CYMTET_38298 [Cymbomonas tetramitiformis]
MVLLGEQFDGVLVTALQLYSEAPKEHEASVNLINPRRNPVGGIRGFELAQGEQPLLQLSLAFRQWSERAASRRATKRLAWLAWKPEAERWSWRLREIRVRTASRQRVTMRCIWFAWKARADRAAQQRELRALVFRAWSIVTLQVSRLQHPFAKGCRPRVETSLRAWC